MKYFAQLVILVSILSPSVGSAEVNTLKLEIESACQRNMDVKISLDASSIDCISAQSKLYEGAEVKICLANLSDSDDSESPCGIVRYSQSHDDDGINTQGECSCIGDWL